MIIGGGSRAGPGDLATHLLRTDENEVARVDRNPRRATADLHRALNRMQAATALTQNGKKGLYHASIDPDNRASHDARSMGALCGGAGTEARAGRPAARLGLSRQARGGRRSRASMCTSVWQRTDIDTRTLRER